MEPLRALPLDVHCHGIGDVDFSDFADIDLGYVDALARRERLLCLPTLYLPRPAFEPFAAFLGRFARLRNAGLIPHLAGVAIEGPLLASFGGTPEQGVWAPTYAEWETLAGLGPLGLRYVVLSPDAHHPGSYLREAMGRDHPPIDWIVRTLVEAGIKPALGHFTRSDPRLSAEAVDEVIEAAESVPAFGARDAVVTDHLFNDMPLAFRHTWRGAEARARRDEELRAAALDEWSLPTIEEQAGPVPGRIMRRAAEGRLAVCLNFDGEHVDTAVARRAVDLVGSRSMMVMTDRTERARLGGQDLHHVGGSTLWYQEREVVAAGSQGLPRQVANMRNAGLSDADIEQLVMRTPARVFGTATPIEPYVPSAPAVAGAGELTRAGSAQSPA